MTNLCNGKDNMNTMGNTTNIITNKTTIVVNLKIMMKNKLEKGF